MCGIVGIISSKEVSGRIINSLKKLEYRGYDSAGIATLVKGNINEVKCEGRVDALERDINKFNLKSFFNSINTISKEINNSLFEIKKNKSNIDFFIKKFGHLRPSSYDIDYKNYKQGFKKYFSIKNVNKIKKYKRKKK